VFNAVRTLSFLFSHFALVASCFLPFPFLCAFHRRESRTTFPLSGLMRLFVLNFSFFPPPFVVFSFCLHETHSPSAGQALSPLFTSLLLESSRSTRRPVFFFFHATPRRLLSPTVEHFFVGNKTRSFSNTSDNFFTGGSLC